MNVADFIVAYLQKNGVERVFGYTGAYALPLFSALRKSDIKVTVPVHEQGAVFMADGYAKISGKIGVVVSTSGPGATNLVTGIASAYMDSVPLLIITANVPLKKLGGDNFQEIDICNIVTPITKYSTICKNAGDIRDILDECLFVATSGRKGPVLLDMPFDVLTSPCDLCPEALSKNKEETVNGQDVLTVAKYLNEVKNIVCVYGGGVKDAVKEVETFNAKINAPYLVTMNAACLIKGANRLGVISAKPEKHILNALEQADIVFAVGTRFNDKSAPDILKKKKIIQVDADAAELDKNYQTVFSAVSDAGAFLNKLLPLVDKKEAADVKAEVFAPAKTYLNVGLIAKNISDNYFGNVVFDVGSHLVKGIKYLYGQKNILLSGGLGSMGYSVPAGLGAYLALKEKSVVITGDGGFNMSAKELITAAREKANMTVFLINDDKLSMVSALQKKQKEKVFCTEKLFENVDYKSLAKAYGVKYLKIKGVKNLEEKIKQALDFDGVCIVDCIIKR